MIVPDIELIVETSGEHHANKVWHEQGQDQKLAAIWHWDPSKFGIGTQKLLPVFDTVVEGSQLACQQKKMKPSGKEDLFGEEAPIDRPLEEKNSAKIESSYDIVEGVGCKEGQGKHHLKKKEN